MYELKVKTHFDAAHRLVDYEGKCNRLHGHRWEVEVCIRGETLDSRGILIDFGEVKKLVKGFVDEKLDHDFLNTRIPERNPTAEFLARWLWEWLANLFVEFTPPVELASVEVWESPESSVKYEP